MHEWMFPSSWQKWPISDFLHISDLKIISLYALKCTILILGPRVSIYFLEQGNNVGEFNIIYLTKCWILTYSLLRPWESPIMLKFILKLFFLYFLSVKNIGGSVFFRLWLNFSLFEELAIFPGSNTKSIELPVITIKLWK